MLRAHVQSFLQTSNLVFCLLDFLVFDIPKSMFILINAEMTTKRRERAKSLEVFFTSYVMFAVFFYENWIF